MEKKGYLGGKSSFWHLLESSRWDGWTVKDFMDAWEKNFMLLCLVREGCKNCCFPHHFKLLSKIRLPPKGYALIQICTVETRLT